MLTLLSHKCTDYLISKNKVSTERRGVFDYGFELLYSTTFCIVSIILFSVIFGYWRYAFMFLLYFIPIRIAAGGYHAKSYENCFFLTNFVALVSVIFSRLLWMKNSPYVEAMMLGLFILSFCYIWKEAPIIPKQYRKKTDRIKINRRYAHIILLIETFVLLFLKISDGGRVVFTGIITTALVAYMMIMAKKGER